jgi:flagellar basal-body rod protein FlgB
LFVSDATNAAAIPLLEKTLAFTEARNRVLAENIANATTPGYRTKQVDVAAFQKMLRSAAEKRAGSTGDLQWESTERIGVDAAGHLMVQPTEDPTENLLFQDGTNQRIERQMAQVAENTMMFQASSQLLQRYFSNLESAIRGRAR